MVYRKNERVIDIEQSEGREIDLLSNQLYGKQLYLQNQIFIILTLLFNICVQTNQAGQLVIVDIEIDLMKQSRCHFRRFTCMLARIRQNENVSNIINCPHQRSWHLLCIG